MNTTNWFIVANDIGEFCFDRIARLKDKRRNTFYTLTTNIFRQCIKRSQMHADRSQIQMNSFEKPNDSIICYICMNVIYAVCITIGHTRTTYEYI